MTGFLSQNLYIWYFFTHVYLKFHWNVSSGKMTRNIICDILIKDLANLLRMGSQILSGMRMFYPKAHLVTLFLKGCLNFLLILGRKGWTCIKLIPLFIMLSASASVRGTEYQCSQDTKHGSRALPCTWWRESEYQSSQDISYESCALHCSWCMEGQHQWGCSTLM